MLAGRSAALAAMLLFAHAGLAQGTSKPALPSTNDQAATPVLSVTPTQADTLRAKALELERLKAQELHRAGQAQPARDEAREPAADRRDRRDRREHADERAAVSLESSRDSFRFAFNAGRDRRDDRRDDDRSRAARGPEWSDPARFRHDAQRPVVVVRDERPIAVGGCYAPVAVFTDCLYIEGRRVEATLTLWADPRCGDLKGKVRLSTCDPRGLPALAVSLNANQGRKNTWYPELDRLWTSSRTAIEWETIGSPSWPVDCMRARLIVTSSCGSQEIEWRDVRVPGAR